jgi:hypothetical protein
MPGLRCVSSVAARCTATLALMVGGVVSVPAQAGGATPGRVLSSTAASADCHAIVPFRRGSFPHHPRINNRFLPLRPGMDMVLSGTVREDDGLLHQHKVLTTVSSVTKVIDGVRTRVVFERDVEDGQLQESELAFAAQDRRGTVWNMGEYPEEYEDGTIVGAPTWIAGIAHARAGVAMRAHPRLGSRAYLQGVAPSVDFRDCGKVASTGGHRCEPVRCFHHVLVVDEWAPLEPEEGHQLKYYAPHVGSIEVGAVGGTNPEVLRLTRHTMLTHAELAKINRKVLAQDNRGYHVSADVYGRTPRAQLGGCEDHRDR